MYDYEPDKWIKMIADVLDKKHKYIRNADFWIESLELMDVEGRIYTQVVPRLSVTFKG